MGGDEHAGPAGLQLPEDLLQLLDGVGVQAHQRLVEDDHPGLVAQGAADGELLLHALGELLAQLVPLVVQFQALQQLVGVGLVLHLVGPADELQVLLHGEQVVHRGHFRDVPQLCLGLQGGVLAAVDFNAPGKPQQPGDALDDGGLPRAVGPQQNANLPVAHGKADVVVGQGLAIAFRHAADG